MVLPTRASIFSVDLSGDAKLGRLRLAASLGYAHTGSERAAITRPSTDNLVSRQHWVGFELNETGTWLARAGRTPAPVRHSNRG